MKLEFDIPTAVIDMRDRWHSASPQQRTYYTNLGLAVGFQVADICLTQIGLSMSGGSGEGGAVADLVYQKGGTLGLTLLKIGGLGLLMRYLEKIRLEKDERVACRFARPLNIFYTGVASVNAFTLYYLTTLDG